MHYLLSVRLSFIASYTHSFTHIFLGSVIVREINGRMFMMQVLFLLSSMTISGHFATNANAITRPGTRVFRPVSGLAESTTLRRKFADPSVVSFPSCGIY